MIRKLFLTIYYLIFSKLPNSAFPLGRIYNKMRVSILKKVISIGCNCKVQRNVYIGNGIGIKVGDSNQINDNVRLDNVSIGNHVMIARDCIFLGKMHEFRDLKTPMIMQGEKDVRQTIIESNVWIGARAIIMPGVTIRNGSIIGAGAVLTKDTETNGIYGGNPAKLIKYRS
jgi:maltose O-acetyltransferase